MSICVSCVQNSSGVQLLGVHVGVKVQPVAVDVVYWLSYEQWVIIHLFPSVQG